MDRLQAFLIIYFYKIETSLNKNSSGLERVKFQSEEANTDEYLKVFFKEFLLKHNKIEEFDILRLVVNTNSQACSISSDELNDFFIRNVFLPDELSIEQKRDIAKSKDSIYTNPDLFLEISNGTSLFYQSLELKSTKTNNIPGSSIQQVSPFEWVIFVKRNKGSVKVTTGFYLHSITDKLPFPDRSPRPVISFNTLFDWNQKHRLLNNNTLLINNNTVEDKVKLNLLKDWQDVLTEQWMEIILLDKSHKKEKWFNNSLRLFTIKLLKKYETLSEDKKMQLFQKLKSQLDNE